MSAPEDTRCACGHVHAADADHEDAGCRTCNCIVWRDPQELHWLTRLLGEASVDAMVPPGYMELRDADGRLLRRIYLGDTMPCSEPDERAGGDRG